MPNIAIVTDSTASIPETMLKELNIYVVAYYIQRDEFLRWLPTDPGRAQRGCVFIL